MNQILLFLLLFINFLSIYGQNVVTPEDVKTLPVKQAEDAKTLPVVQVEDAKTEIKKDETSIANQFKLSWDGIFFPRYEQRDRTPIGRDDRAGSSEETTGFGMARTYINLRGKIDEGKYKGIAFRITSDIAPFGRLGDGCKGDSCERSNPYSLYMKYAFIQLPVMKSNNTFIRVGQQHDPTVNAQSRISLQEDGWGHRYIAQTTWEELGLSPSVDRGISLIHNAKFYAAHVLLANGEGPFRNNGERTNSAFRNPETTVSDLSRGIGDSYGLSASSLISFIPTGDQTKHKWSINLPFRFENLAGVNVNETQFLSADICGAQTPLPPSATVTAFNAPSTVCEFSQSGAPNFSYYKGTKRAKQDYSFGAETDYSYHVENLKFTFGIGTITKVDRGGEALRISRGLLNGGSPGLSASDSTSYYQTQNDRVGNANYILAHAKWKDYGAFFRFTMGTGGGKNLGQLGTRDSKSWTQQVYEQDVKNNIIGDFNLADMGRIDMGKAVFRSIVLGVTYAYTPEFLISFGVTETRATDSVGRPLRENVLERIPALAGSSANGKNLSEQIESPQSFYSNTSSYNSLGYSLPGQFATNEWIGRDVVNRQVFLRAQFMFGTIERMSERN